MASLVECALSYSARGWRVFPLHSIRHNRCSCMRHDCDRAAKHPRTKNGLTDATLDEQTIRDWWTSWPDANIGIATGAASGFVVLDVDPRHGGDDSLANLEKMPDTVEALTGGGGRHILFAHPGSPVGNSSGKIGVGLDIRGDGGYIVAPPSVHTSGKRYEWESSSNPGDVDLAPMPKWLLMMLNASAAKRDAKPADEPIPAGQRNNTLASIAGAMRRQGAPSAAIRAALSETNLARCVPPLPEEEVDAIAQSVSRYKPVAKSEPPPHDDKDAPVHDIRTGAVIEDAAQSLGKTYANLCRILREDDFRSQLFGSKALEFNEMLGQPTIGRLPVVDTHYGKLREHIERKFRNAKGEGLRFSTEDIAQATRQIAAERPFHPVRDYLRSIQWDSVPRIGLVLGEVLKADPNDLASVLIRRWFIAAVARAMRPGCKVDSVLILVGRQGAGKSRFFGTLAGEFFSDTAVDISNKDAYQALGRSWIIEWAELESMQRARDAAAVKSFLTSCHDTYRAPYAREMESKPRTCVIVGTTNEREFLTDPTGNRRYWIVNAGERIDIERLSAWRDQLWAEAVCAYDSGEPWHLTFEQEQELAASHVEHERRDPWEHEIVGFLATADLAIVGDLTTGVILDKAIHKPSSQWTRSDQMRVATIMERSGYVCVRKLSEVGRVRVWERSATGHGED